MEPRESFEGSSGSPEDRSSGVLQGLLAEAMSEPMPMMDESKHWHEGFMDTPSEKAKTSKEGAHKVSQPPCCHCS